MTVRWATLATAIPAVAMMLTAAACEGEAMTFDKTRWAAERGNYDGESARGAMVSSIDDAGVRVGATRDQVRSVLGEPDSTGPAADIYYLGRSRSGPSFETYRIDYSTAGTVTAMGVRRS